MSPSDYTVQEHIAELHRVAAQVRLAREVHTQPKIAVWLARLTAALRRQPQARVETLSVPCVPPCTSLPGGAH